MKYWLLSTFVALCFAIHSQTETIYIHDLENGTLDSIVSFQIDTTLTSANTGYFKGEHSSNIAPLSDVFPTMNTFPQSDFTYKKRVEIDYSVDDFPIRAAVKTFGVSGGQYDGQCSGSMISRKHVLTAAHCNFSIGTNDLSRDTFIVCPAYDNGSAHPDFGCIEVSKIYVLKGWGLPGEDFSILELKESIGYETGWLGVGFQEDSSTMVNQMHYKFSYPATYEPLIDSNVYNGDTMYYNYGKINYLTETSLGVSGGTGIPGESGSPLIRVENDQEYTVYGTFTFVSNLVHARIDNTMYHVIFSIIENDLNLDEPNDGLNVMIYPNPATNLLHVEGLNSMSVLGIQNSIGQEVSGWRQNGDQLIIDQISSGMYFLLLETDLGKISLRFAKQ